MEPEKAKETPGATMAPEDLETPKPKPKPKLKPNQKLVTVYNASMTGQCIYMGKGGKIQPGKTGKIPYGVYKRISHMRWVQKAERGDVPG